MAEQWTIKYRPKSFKDVYGLSPVKKYFYNAAKTKQWPTAVLFDGETGTGKTTSAMIIAAMMTCLHPDKDGNPCGECIACKDIFEERFTMDVKSYTVGSTSAIDIINEAAELIKTPPFRLKEKVIIINEIQNIKSDSQKKMLDLLETKTPHVHFILTTMEGTKDRAVTNRCTLFKFKFVSTDEIITALTSELQKHNAFEQWTKFDPKAEALALIASASYGSYRTAIQTLQTVLEMSPSSIEEVRQACPAVDEGFAYAAVQHLFAPKVNKDQIFEDLIEAPEYGHMFNYIKTMLTSARVYKLFGKLPPDKAWMANRLAPVISSPFFDKIYKMAYDVPNPLYLTKADYTKFVCDVVDLLSVPVRRAV